MRGWIVGCGWWRHWATGVIGIKFGLGRLQGCPEDLEKMLWDLGGSVLCNKEIFIVHEAGDICIRIVESEV